MEHGSQFPPDFRLILASQSPRRHSLLRDVGIPFSVVSSDAEESIDGADAITLTERNALAKVRGASLPAGLQPGTFILGTDTLVTHGGSVMGKPVSAAEALQMLESLSGCTHEVVSGVALARTDESGVPCGAEGVRVASALTAVTFMPLGERQIAAYLASGEWKGKAGAYGIQGRAGLFVSEIRGEYSNVVGLPLCLLAHLFWDAGFDLTSRQWVGRGCRKETGTSPSQ